MLFTLAFSSKQAISQFFIVLLSSEVGIELKSAIIVGYGFLVLLEARVSVASIVVGKGMLRVELNGSVIVG